MEQITLPGIMASHDAIIDFVSKHAALAGLDEKTMGKLHLAVDEIATNIIIHGYEENGQTGDIMVLATITPEALVITMEDTSPPFDPRTRETPASLGKPLEERPIGGLGIYLMLKSVDRFDYEYLSGRNRNIFVVNRPMQVP